MPKTYSAKMSTRPVRLSYVTIDEASVKKSLSGKYSVVALIPKSDKIALKNIKAKMLECYENNPSILGDFDFDTLVRIYDGAKAAPKGKKYPPEYKDFWVMNCSNKRPPLLQDANGEELLDSREIYSGCWARLGLAFYPYSQQAGTGIGVSLDIIRKYKDDDSFAGSVVTEDYFGDDDEDEDSDDI